MHDGRAPAEKMKIDGTSFGSIIIDGEQISHDIWIFNDESIERRNRNHHFSLDELKILLRGSPKIIVVGTGQSGVVKTDPEAKAYAEEQMIEIICLPTPEAIKRYNKLKKAKKKIAAAFHVTC